jgi:hypothetical protein
VNTTPVKFRLADHVAKGAVAFLATDVQDAEKGLLELLDTTALGTIVRVDVARVRIASAAVRGLLRRALRRIQGGDQAELLDRYIVLENIGDSWHSFDVTLKSENLLVTGYRSASDRASLLGEPDIAVAETYRFMQNKEYVTAKMVMAHFELNTIAAASNRLATLLKYGLVRRVEERPTVTGGRQYLYQAIQ